LRRSLFPPQAQTLEKAHGRIEERRIWVSTQLHDYLDFPHCRQVARIQRHTTLLRSGKIRAEQAFILTSLSPEKGPPETLLALVRGHWGIENRSHWVRDVTFDEDRSQIRTGSAPRMMAILRNLAIGIIRLLGFSHVPEGLRYFSRRAHVLAVLGL
jgi:hypothetical protein